MTDFTKTYRRTTYPAISPTNPSNSQSGRKVCIIGASEGIGFEIAKAYIEAGAAEVTICGRNEMKLKIAAIQLEQQTREDFGRTEARVLDAGNVEDVKHFWQTIKSEKRTIDILILSAAHTETINEFNPEDVATYFNQNCIAKLFMVDGFRRAKRARPEGVEPAEEPVLIDLSSAGLMGYPYPKAAYSASKAGFTTWLCHLSDMIEDMRIINFHPGAVFTPAAERSGEAPRDLKIWDDPSLSAHMAVWLSTPAAAFLHGRFVWANWDVEELMGMKDRILADPGFIKIGVSGVENFSIAGLVQKCEEQPLKKD